MTREELEQIIRASGMTPGRTADAVQVLGQLFGEGITSFQVLKKGMTNRLFFFETAEQAYLLRIPGEGTERLVDRDQEAWVYETLSARHMTDRYVFLSPENGIKITEYLTGAHVCDVDNWEEVCACIAHLRAFHQMKLGGRTEFDLHGKIRQYEGFCAHDPGGCLPDYRETRRKMDRLWESIRDLPKERHLCHIDSVPDNFLIQDGRVSLIDWEYAALCDPHVDIAMFCIYAGYDRAQIDRVTDFYFSGACPPQVRRKIYGYVALCGFLWSLWCEVKRDCQVLFEDYEARQYRYALDFYGLAMDPERGGERLAP